MSGTTPFVACETPLMMARSDLASAMRELQIAHQIILNALTVMDAEAKRNWIQLNERTGVTAMAVHAITSACGS